MGNRKYEFTYTLTGKLGSNKIKVEAKSETKAAAKFKNIMELSGIGYTGYFIREITYIKGE